MCQWYIHSTVGYSSWEGKAMNHFSFYPFSVLLEVDMTWSAYIWSHRNMNIKGPLLFVLVLFWYLKATSDTYIHGFLLLRWFLAVAKSVKNSWVSNESNRFPALLLLGCNFYWVYVTLTCYYSKHFSHHLCFRIWHLDIEKCQLF